MPNVDGKSLTPEEAMLLGRCPECGTPLIPRIARSHAESHWGADPLNLQLSKEASRRFNLLLDFAKPRLEDREKGREADTPRRTSVSENHSPAREFIAAILLAAVVTPFWNEGTKALFDGAYLRMVVAYAIGSIPAIAAILTVANYWPRLRTSAGSWVVNHVGKPLTSDLRWWFAVVVFLFLGISWPRFIILLREPRLAQQQTTGDVKSTPELTPSESKIDGLKQQLAEADAQIAALQSSRSSAIVPTPTQSTGPITWNGSFGFSQTTDASGELMLLAVVFDGKNTSSAPIQLTDAYIISELTGEKETLQVNIGPGQLIPIGEINQIPPDATIELYGPLKPGLHAAEFLERWGKLRLHAEYGNNTQYDRIFDEKTVAAYLNQFPFSNLGPHVTKKPQQ
jgi:hypothetical protein